METGLSGGETVIKSWESRGRRKLNLIVTNRRIVSTVHNERSVKSKEISVFDVKTVSGNYDIVKPAVWKIILAVYLLYSGFGGLIVATVMSKIIVGITRWTPIIIPFCSILLVLGVLLLLRKKQCRLRITCRNISGDGNNSRNAKNNGIDKTLVILPIVAMLLSAVAFRLMRTRLAFQFIAPILTWVGIIILALIVLMIKHITKKGKKVSGSVDLGLMKFRISKEVLNEIINEIGAAILEAQQNNTKKEPA